MQRSMFWMIEYVVILGSLRLELRWSPESVAPPRYGCCFSCLGVHDLGQGQQGIDRPAVLLLDQGMEVEIIGKQEGLEAGMVFKHHPEEIVALALVPFRTAEHHCDGGSLFGCMRDRNTERHPPGGLVAVEMVDQHDPFVYVDAGE